MDKFREQFKKEKNFTYWAEGCNYGSFNDDYVNWLEKKLALTIPVVVGQSEQFICRDCEKPSKEYRDQLCEPCHKWHTDS